MVEYRRLRDRGESWRLVRTVDGELTLYRPEEVGFVRGGSGVTVRTVGGLRVLAVVFTAFTVALVLALPISWAAHGRPFWGAIPLALLSAAFTWYAVAIIRKEKRAVALRRERGVPEPAHHPY
jgi:4-hydroxybenzoate polyprenyltransferase